MTMITPCEIRRGVWRQTIDQHAWMLGDTYWELELWGDEASDEYDVALYRGTPTPPSSPTLVYWRILWTEDTDYYMCRMMFLRYDTLAEAEATFQRYLVDPLALIVTYLL